MFNENLLSKEKKQRLAALRAKREKLYEMHSAVQHEIDQLFFDEINLNFKEGDFIKCAAYEESDNFVCGKLVKIARCTDCLRLEIENALSVFKDSNEMTIENCVLFYRGENVEVISQEEFIQITQDVFNEYIKYLKKM